MNKFILLLLLSSNIYAQDFISSDEFKIKTSKGICIVEFWAEWNKSNEVQFLETLKDCITFKLCIVSNSKIQREYEIIAIPTVIIFNNGVEQERFNPNIMMQLSATEKEVQSVIDEITLNKFQ
jgi:thioredoxin-like negative regulator of GroEL